MTTKKKPGRPVSQPCGTYAAARRHQRNGEPLCAACRDALAEAQHGWYVARKEQK